MMMSFKCSVCGADRADDAKEYDGMLGYEAIVCKRCGTMYDHSGQQEADEWTFNFVGLKKMKEKITCTEWTKSKLSFALFVANEKDETSAFRKITGMTNPIIIDEEIYNYFLSTVSPIYVENGFLCSEPVLNNYFDKFTCIEGVYYYEGLKSVR
jgi:DNA-directed RNA polymerase subunit RPC12/RpoP